MNLPRKPRNFHHQPESAGCADAERNDPSLLRVYREACPDFEPSANFLPELWGRIEERQERELWFSRAASGLAGLSLAAAVFMAAFVVFEDRRETARYLAGTYVEALSTDRAMDDLAEPPGGWSYVHAQHEEGQH